MDLLHGSRPAGKVNDAAVLTGSTDNWLSYEKGRQLPADGGDFCWLVVSQI